MAVLIDYRGTIDSTGAAFPAGEQLLDAWSDRYRMHTPKANLRVFDFAGATFLIDEAPADANRPVRTIGAFTRALRPDVARETTYQAGYPLEQDGALRPVDRGHLVPYTAGGMFGPNLFRQDRALNRGWSMNGRLYRDFERRAVHAGAFFFCALDYCDTTDYPSIVELGLWDDKGIESEPFRNRWDDEALNDLPAPANEERALQHFLAGLTTAQVGDLGEEAIGAYLQEEGAMVVVAFGDSQLPRNEGRQDLDLVVIDETGELLAVEVKTRYFARNAGTFTRAGYLHRPRLRRPPTGAMSPRQGSIDYVRSRMGDIIDVDEDTDVQFIVFVVDLRARVLQRFTVTPADRITGPVGPPVDASAHILRAIDTLRTAGTRAF